MREMSGLGDPLSKSTPVQGTIFLRDDVAQNSLD